MRIIKIALIVSVVYANYAYAMPEIISTKYNSVISKKNVNRDIKVEPFIEKEVENSEVIFSSVNQKIALNETINKVN